MKKWVPIAIVAGIVVIAGVVSVNFRNMQIAEEVTATAQRAGTATQAVAQAQERATQMVVDRGTKTAIAQAVETQQSIGTATAQAQATFTAQVKATQTAEIRAKEAEIEESAEQACVGLGGHEDAPPYSILDGPTLLVAFYSESNKLTPRSSYISRDWLGESVEEVQLVICVDELDEIEVESCPYSYGGGGTADNWIKRVQEQIQVKIVALNGGYTVDTKVFQGDTPKSCPDHHAFSTSGATVTFAGKVDPSNVRDWIESYLAP